MPGTVPARDATALELSRVSCRSRRGTIAGMTHTVWDALAARAANIPATLSDELHETFAGHAERAVRAAWLRRVDCPGPVLDLRAGRERDEELLIAIAVHPNLGARGRRLLAEHGTTSVAVAVALRGDVGDDEGVNILRSRRRSAVRAALDRRNHLRWPLLAPWDHEDRWWDGLRDRPTTAGLVARYIPLAGFDSLLKVAAQESVWSVFDSRLTGMDVTDDEAVASMLALRLAHDRPLTAGIRRAAARHGGLFAAYVALANTTTADPETLRSLSAIPALNTDPGVRMLCALPFGRLTVFVTATGDARLLRALVLRHGDLRSLGEHEWLQLIDVNPGILSSITIDGGEPPRWTRRGVEGLVGVIKDRNLDHAERTVVALAADHLDLLIDGCRQHQRLLRAVAAHPACTLEHAMSLPVSVAFAAYHDPVGLAEAVLDAAGSGLDVLSTISTQFQGSVAELVSVSVQIDAATV
jgi:hypothetical protein